VLLASGETCASQGYDEIDDETTCFGIAKSRIDELQVIPDSKTLAVDGAFACVLQFGSFLFFGD